MVEAPGRVVPRGLVGRVAGIVTERVVDVVDPDIVLDHIDVNSLLDKVDVQRVLERVDLDPVLQRVDFEALLSRVDLNAVLNQIDLTLLLERVDLNRMLAQVDVKALARRAGIAEIVTESTNRLAGSTLDVPRRQVAAVDFWVKRGVGDLLRRPPDSVRAAPKTLAVVSQPQAGERREVTGQYAGPVARLLAFVVDSVVVTGVYAGAGATLEWVARLLFDRGLLGSAPPWVSAVVLGTWLLTYFFGSLAVAGRTPGQALVGVRVVRRDGIALSPLAALVRTLSFPASLMLLGAGLVGVVIGREHRALHDVLAGSAAVVDFGDRPAQLPAPLSRFLARQERGSPESGEGPVTDLT
jgi:uncharacterized RDD family membrane protein YckC